MMSEKSCQGSSKLVCKSSAPYPEVIHVSENCEAVRLLLLDYASPASELSALHSYMYQHVLLLKSHPEIAAALECIGIVEMTHAVMLANAITVLGGDPRYMSIGQRQEPEYWQAVNVDYSKFVKDILMRNISAEESAIAQYEHHAAVIPIPQVQALLRRITEDERLHVQILNQLLRSLT